MKVLAFERDAATAVVAPPQLTIMPDSALVTGNNPLFIPDFSTRWSVRLYLAFHLCRLGKGISPKFAPRYRDAVSVAVRVIPTDIEELYAAGGSATGLLGAFDNALSIGRWIEIPADGRLTVEADGLSASTTLDDCGVDRCIALLSDYMTLKMGDVVMPVKFPLSAPVIPDTTLTAGLNGEPVVNLRFK